MAYGKRTFKRFKRTKKPWYRRKYSVAEIAGKAYSTAKYLRGIINSEKKFCLTSASLSPDYNGSVSGLSDIAQGDDYGNRNGRSILAKSLTFNWSVTQGSSDATVSIYLVKDTSRNLDATTPTCSALLTSTGSLYAPHSTILQNSQGRFKILKHWKVNVHTNKPRTQGSAYIKLNCHIKYDDTTAVQSAANLNAIYVMAISDTAGGVYDPDFRFQSKLLFYDN